MAKDWTQDETIKQLEKELEKQADEIERLRKALKDTYDQLLDGDLTEVLKTLRSALQQKDNK